MYGNLEAANAPRETVPRRAGLAQAFVAHVYDVPLAEMRGAKRGHPRAALARQVAMYLSHVVFGMHISAIAVAFARHKTTVHHALKHIESLRDDAQFDGSLRVIEATLREASGGGA